MKCTYCNLPAFMPGVVMPPMCEKHFDLRLVLFHLKRQGQQCNARNVARAITRKKDRELAVKPGEVGRLLRQVIRVEETHAH